MKNTLTEILKEYQALELASHVSLDDVILKVTQEVSELSGAFESSNIDETQKEASDVIVNILSASSKLWALPSEFDPKKELSTGSELLQMLGKWNQTIQALRGRYARNSATTAELMSLTQTFVSSVLSFADPSKAIEDIVQSNSAKLKDRVVAYKSDLNLEDFIREYQDFPKPGINFRDISPILASPEAMRYASFELAYKCRDADVIAGLDARGFLFGMAVAGVLGKPFVMIRKKGKLPGEAVGVDYSLEYGDNSIEIQRDAIEKGQKVAIIDDLLATGGTFAAAASLVEKVGGQVESLVTVIALNEPGLVDHKTRKSLEKYRIESLLSYA